MKYLRAVNCMISTAPKHKNNFPVVESRYEDFVAFHVNATLGGSVISLNIATQGHDLFSYPTTGQDPSSIQPSTTCMLPPSSGSPSTTCMLPPSSRSPSTTCMLPPSSGSPSPELLLSNILLSMIAKLSVLLTGWWFVPCASLKCKVNTTSRDIQIRTYRTVVHPQERSVLSYFGRTKACSLTS
jgi:hypothetical protein